MNVLIINNQTHNIELIQGFFSEDSIRVISCFDVKFEDSESVDLIVLSGSMPKVLPSVLNAQDILKNEIAIIQNSNKPIIGICYGCELIAQVYGCKVEKISPKVVNFVDIEPEGEILGFHKKSFKVFDSHKYVITELSDNIIGMAKSEYGYEIIRHKDKVIYGTQFHPEKFQDLTEGDDIFRKIIQIAKDETKKS